MQEGKGFPREYFWNHPLFASGQALKNPRAVSGGRPKVFCKQCWTVLFSAEKSSYRIAAQEGRRHEPRSDQEIQTLICWVEQIRGQ